MIRRAFSVKCQRNPAIAMEVTPGHFTTSSSHVSHYLDMNELKTNAALARDSAEELAVPYLSGTLVDTIVCMEGTQVIGAFLAQALLQDGTMVMNSGGEIHVVTPVSNTNGQLVFSRNIYHHITDKNIVLLIASASSGKTAAHAIQCLRYYGGHLAGISALFAAVPTYEQTPIHSLFTADDIPGYHFSQTSDCRMCATGKGLDAIITSSGYHEI